MESQSGLVIGKWWLTGQSEPQYPDPRTPPCWEQVSAADSRGTQQRSPGGSRRNLPQLFSWQHNIILFSFLSSYIQNVKGTSRRWRSSYDIFVVVQLQKEWVAAKDNLDRQNWLSTWTGKWLLFFNNWSFSWFWDCVWHSSFQFKINRPELKD